MFFNELWQYLANEWGQNPLPNLKGSAICRHSTEMFYIAQLRMPNVSKTWVPIKSLLFLTIKINNRHYEIHNHHCLVLSGFLIYLSLLSLNGFTPFCWNHWFFLIHQSKGSFVEPHFHLGILIPPVMYNSCQSITLLWHTIPQLQLNGSKYFYFFAFCLDQSKT